MMDIFTTRGVPQSIVHDGWWLGADDPPVGQSPVGAAEEGPASRVARVLLLVALADLLFWRHAPGLSLAVFALAILLAAGAARHPHRTLLAPVAMVLIGAAPVIDYVQPLSLAFLVAGLTAALIRLNHADAGMVRIALGIPVVLHRLPLAWLGLLRPRRLRRVLPVLGPGLWLRDWAIPVGGGLVFAALLMDANPVLARLVSVRLDLWQMVERVMFWAGMALIVTPFLATDLPLGPAPQPALQLRVPGINARSVLRALVLFNAMIGVQMGTDAAILIGGAALPPGMGHAEYAHRGAYPLLATAILAGAFALAARPFLHEHRLIRPLLLLWLLQNIILCGAAALRLDLYIGAYGLTYLRVYALIWMGLVAAGLMLIGWQSVRGHGMGWLALRWAVLGAGTLYACSFVNFAGIIAARNLTQAGADLVYVCDLGPMASGAVYQRLAVARVTEVTADDIWRCPALGVPRTAGWREWGFRSWRVARKVRGVFAAGYPQ